MPKNVGTYASSHSCTNNRTYSYAHTDTDPCDPRTDRVDVLSNHFTDDISYPSNGTADFVTYTRTDSRSHDPAHFDSFPHRFTHPLPNCKSSANEVTNSSCNRKPLADWCDTDGCERHLYQPTR